MSQSDNFDQRAYDIAVASVRRHSMDAQSWRHTRIGDLHPGIGAACELMPGERIIASGFLSEDSWWAVSTRRIVSRHRGATQQLDPRHGVESKFGNFKGVGDGAQAGPAFETAVITSGKDGAQLRLEYETGKASMAPIYACRFWARATGFHYAAEGA